MKAAAEAERRAGSARAQQQRTAAQINDVALIVEGYTGRLSGKLGVFEHQLASVQGRPTYKMPGKEYFLYYTTNNQWAVGRDISKAECFWLVVSSVQMPDAITTTEKWEVYHGETKEWKEVINVTCRTTAVGGDAL